MNRWSIFYVLKNLSVFVLRLFPFVIQFTRKSIKLHINFTILWQRNATTSLPARPQLLGRKVAKWKIKWQENFERREHFK